MKGLSKKIKFVAAISCAAVSALAFSACGEKGTVYEGDYHYATNYGTYGAKVQVRVYEGKITNVTSVKSDYSEASEGWDGRQNYLSNKEKLLRFFEGKTVEEVMSYAVKCSENGAPLVYSVDENAITPLAIKGDLITGATQSSGRMILAVQNALSKING